MKAPRTVIIGVCTYRRAQLRDTLASLAALTSCPDLTIQVIVADNDDTPSARPVIDAIGEWFPHPLIYLHAPARNISVARNAILQAARAQCADLLAFLDDDEWVEPDWLMRMERRMHEAATSAVVGPVRAKHLETAPGWMRHSAIHDTTPDVDARGHAHTGYTCNMLIHLRAPAFDGLSFDETLGRSGGEDTAFFAAYQARGGEIAFAPDAVAHEIVPEARATMRWLMRRRYRMGLTHGEVIAAGRLLSGRLAQAGLAGAKSAACLGLMLAGIFSETARNKAILRLSLHVGVIAGCLGGKRPEHYGGAAPAVRRAE